MKIVAMEEMLSQIKSGQFDHPLDVELLLYHDHPLFAAYDQWQQSEFGMRTAVNETISDFIVKTKERKTSDMAELIAPNWNDSLMRFRCLNR